jgi:NAD(P)-dependent dehydrogenase (short-subunit alcohol dehydrogenase family)
MSTAAACGAAPDVRLDGKTALVTGAGRGLGHAFCRRLAADGAHVVALDIDDPTPSLAALSGLGDKLALRCDVSRPEDIEAVRDTVTARFGRCDILVNNAAIFPTTTLDSVTLEVWRRVQATNVDAVLLFAQAVAPGMKAAGWGRIVNIGSSITTSQGTEMVAYMTSKGAVHTLTRALANELGAEGVTVNAIAPTIVPTEGLLARPGGIRGLTNEEVIDRTVSRQTVNRRATPADLAGALAWLVSDDAAFVTGQILHVDGGLVRSGA